MNYSKEWSELLRLFRIARDFKDVIDSPDTAPLVRVFATKNMVRTCDLIVEKLSLLSQAGVLSRIGLWLAMRKVRA